MPPVHAIGGHRVKIGFKTAQADVDWPTLLATWDLAEQMPIFDSGWLFDHFVSLRTDAGPSFEGWTLAAALAARTSRLVLGHLMLGNTYRDPALLARMAATLDHVADGRFVLGLGAAWHEGEHAMYGWRFPPAGERIDLLRASVGVIRALWSNPDGVTLDAPPFTLSAATCHPAPLTPNGPPLWLGVSGPRGIRIAAELADGWNHTGPAETFIEQRDILLRRCEAIGRDPDEIEISTQLSVRGRDYPRVVTALAEHARHGARHLILSMPAAEGPDGLRRLVKRAAEPLRELFPD